MIDDTQYYIPEISEDENELFVKIYGYGDCNEQYLISNRGRLFSARTHMILKPELDRYGYLYYVLSVNNHRQTVKAHRLVAEMWIPNPENKPTVDHRDTNRTNNRVENLRWATSYEQSHNEKTLERLREWSKLKDFRKIAEFGNCNRHETEVYREDKETGERELLGKYNSLKDAANAHGVSASKASECANGIRWQTKGLLFRFVGANYEEVEKEHADKQRKTSG